MELCNWRSYVGVKIRNTIESAMSNCWHKFKGLHPGTQMLGVTKVIKNFKKKMCVPRRRHQRTVQPRQGTFVGLIQCADPQA